MEKELFDIVLADDDEGDRHIFKEALEELEIKHRVHIVNNGMQLMDYLTKKDTSLPDLIFLDLNMPYKNGMECLKEIRHNEKFKSIAIAIYSTSGSEKDVEDTFLSGANIYIKKPNNFAMLRQLLFKVVAATYLYQDESFNRKNFFLSI